MADGETRELKSDPGKNPDPEIGTFLYRLTACGNSKGDPDVQERWVKMNYFALEAPPAGSQYGRTKVFGCGPEIIF